MVCDECRSQIDDGGFVLVTTVSDTEKESYLVCSSDCLLDYTARLFKRMKEQES